MRRAPDLHLVKTFTEKKAGNTIPTRRERMDSTLKLIYSLVMTFEIDEATDVLFKYVDDLLSTQKFSQCDEFLQAIDLDRLDSNLILALLSLTRAAEKDLPYRPKLLTKARARLVELDPHRADRILGPD